MRVARLHGARDLRLHDEAVPVPGPGEILLRVTAVGLCGSDRHWYAEGSIGEVALQVPLVLGHEVGAVVASGPRTGERVAVDPALPCGSCDVCRSGRGRLCPAVGFAGHGSTDGGLREWMPWRDARCHPVPDRIADLEVPLLEVLGVALHALDLAQVTPNLRAGVYGAGPVGLMVIAALRAAGIRQIVATDRLVHRLDAARTAGASDTILVMDGEDPASVIPVDVAFECAGEDAAIDMAVRALRPGGRAVLVGIPSGERSAFRAAIARRKELGLLLCRRMEARDLVHAIELVASGAVVLAPFISQRFGLEDSAAAFEALLERRGEKVVVAP